MGTFLREHIPVRRATIEEAIEARSLIDEVRRVLQFADYHRLEVPVFLRKVQSSKQTPAQ